MLILSPAISVIHAEPAVIFVGERHALRVECGAQGALLVQRAAESPCVAHWLRGIAPGLAGQIVRALRDCGFLAIGGGQADVAEPFARNAGWLALHSPEPEAAHALLAGRRVAILGVGGVGSEVLRHLAGAGVRSFYLIDGDRVEPSNLNRQYLFCPSDFGAPKAGAAARAITRCYADVDIACAERMVERAADLDCLDGWAADLLICAADSPVDRIEAIVDAYAQTAGLAWIGGGVGLERGYWGPVFPARGCPCHPCATQTVTEAAGGAETVSGDEPDGEDDWTRALPRTRSVSSFGPSNAVVAGLLARDALVWLLSTAQGRPRGSEEDPWDDGMARPAGRRVIDLMTMTITAPAPVRCQGACAA